MGQNDMRRLWNESEPIKAEASAEASAEAGSDQQAGARPGLDFSSNAAKRAMESYETEYEMVADVDSRTGQTRFYLPSTYRAMAAARIRRDRKRALRREMYRLGITDVTIV